MLPVVPVLPVCPVGPVPNGPVVPVLPVDPDGPTIKLYIFKEDVGKIYIITPVDLDANCNVSVSPVVNESIVEYGMDMPVVETFSTDEL